MRVAGARLKQNFSRAAAEYDARAQFQHIQTNRVLDAALMLLPDAAHIADIGCGTGYFAYEAAEKRPHWSIYGVDISEGMCAVASGRCTAIAADAVALPLADRSVDAVVSSLCYQWVENQAAAFAEIARVLKPGGRAIVASLGAATLHELRASSEAVGAALGLLPMRDFASVKADLARAGFDITLADCRVATEHYASVPALLDSMRAIGAGNNFAGRESAFLGPKRFAAMIAEYEKLRSAQGIPARWEHHFFILHKPL